MADSDALDDLLVEDQRFAVVPEWVLDAGLSDSAFRLYVVLLRYGATSGVRMPSRKTLGARLRKSVDTVDRALRELQAAGIVVVERRRDAGRQLTNRYHLRTSDPGRTGAAPVDNTAPGRTGAAGVSRTDAAPGGRTDAAGGAARVRHDRVVPTESTPTDTAALTARLGAVRLAAGLPAWSRRSVTGALARARARGWPADRVVRALELVAADPTTRSPLRVAEAGPWWETTAVDVVDQPDPADVALWERELDELDGRRLHLQQQARSQLRHEGRPLNRLAVLERAHQLLEEERHVAAPAAAAAT